MSCDSSDCSLCHYNQSGMGGHVAAAHLQGVNRNPKGRASSGTQRCRKRTADFASCSKDSSGGALPVGARIADAASVASLPAPRRRKSADSVFAAAAAAPSAVAQPSGAPQRCTLHRSEGSSTKLEELCWELPACTSAFADASPRPSPTAAGSPGSPHAGDRSQLAPPENETTRLPACLLHRRESAQSSATWLSTPEPQSRSSECEAGPLRGVAARLQLRVRSAAALPGPERPLLREVAVFQHPRAEGCRSRSPPCRPHADIVCDVKFSLDGELIATAGVGKQVWASPLR